MHHYSIDQICSILKISKDTYDLTEEQIEEYFNNFIKYLNVPNPAEFIELNFVLGCCHGLYILMLGRDLKEIDNHYQGTSETKKQLFERFSTVNQDIISEILVLGQLSRNRCDLEYYKPVGSINPEALIRINGNLYCLDVTKVHWQNDSGQNIKERIGLEKLQILVDMFPLEFLQFENKTIVITPKKSFQLFVDEIIQSKTFKKYFLDSHPEVKIIEGFKREVEGFHYECKIGNKIILFSIVSCMGAVYSKIKNKCEAQYCKSPHDFLLYIDLSRLDYMGIGNCICEAQQALNDYKKCAGVILFDRFAVDALSKNFDLFNECYFIANGDAEHPIKPIMKNEEYDCSEIDKLIISSKNYYFLTKGINVRLIHKK